MVELQQTKDNCVDHLTTKEGIELEIMANLMSTNQIDTVIEGHLCKAFGSSYGVDKYETLLRCSVSYRARGRDDLTGIGKTPDNTGTFNPRMQE